MTKRSPSAPPAPASTPSPGGLDPAVSNGAPLPAGLRRALEAVSSPSQRNELERFFRVAVRAMRAFEEIDLRRYEPSEETTADLLAWEQVAPIVGSTMAEVNLLLSTVEVTLEQTLPAAENDDSWGDVEIEDLLQDGETPSGPSPEASPNGDDGATKAAFAIHGIASGLRMEVTSFASALRNPRVVADRWNLLDHIEAFRGRFRTGIGEMIFSAASCFTRVRKEELIPGYRNEIERSIGLRRAVSLLSARISKENAAAKSSTANLQELRGHAGRAAKLLERLMAGKAWTAVRADDKRAFASLHSALERQLGDTEVTPAGILETLEGLDRFVESLCIINQRETLIVHDREALPRLARIASTASKAVLDRDDTKARGSLKEALDLGWRLVGRDPALSEVLLRARRLDVTALDGDDIAFWADTIVDRAEAVPLP